MTNSATQVIPEDQDMGQFYRTVASSVRSLAPYRERIVAPDQSASDTYIRSRPGVPGFLRATDVGVPQVRHRPQVGHVMIPGPIAPQAHRFRVLKAWEGTVLDARNGDETFVARLFDRACGEADEAEIYRAEVSDEDLQLLDDGAIFYWTIGYRVGPDGRERVSRIKFRRLPAWSQDALQVAERAASVLAAELGWDDADDSA